MNRITLRIRAPKRTLRQAVAWVTVLHQHRHPQPVTVADETMGSFGVCSSDLEAAIIAFHDTLAWIVEHIYAGGYSIGIFVLRLESNHEPFLRCIKARLLTVSPSIVERLRNCHATLKQFQATECEACK